MKFTVGTCYSNYVNCYCVYLDETSCSLLYAPEGVLTLVLMIAEGYKNKYDLILQFATKIIQVMPALIGLTMQIECEWHDVFKLQAAYRMMRYTTLKMLNKAETYKSCMLNLMLYFVMQF